MQLETELTSSHSPHPGAHIQPFFIHRHRCQPAARQRESRPDKGGIAARALRAFAHDLDETVPDPDDLKVNVSAREVGALVVLDAFSDLRMLKDMIAKFK